MGGGDAERWRPVVRGRNRGIFYFKGRVNRRCSLRRYVLLTMAFCTGPQFCCNCIDDANAKGMLFFIHLESRGALAGMTAAGAQVLRLLILSGRSRAPQ